MSVKVAATVRTAAVAADLGGKNGNVTSTTSVATKARVTLASLFAE
ncbi:MAG: hypothetical protein ACJ78T_13980 [Myxococcales bacterium]